jgi:hypothetical protein
MKRPLIRTELTGFTPAEWNLIGLGAEALLRSGAEAGTLILPGRPELFRLDRQGNRFLLRLSDAQELSSTLLAEARAMREALL